MFNIEPARLKTGFLLTAFLAVILFLNNIYIFWILFTVFLFISIYEIANLSKIPNAFPLYVIGMIVVVFSLFFPKSHYVVSLILLFLASFYSYKGSFDNKTFKAVVYPILPISFFFSLVSEYELINIVWLIVVVSISDIGAYIVGKQIGKTKFAKVSPNKTIEGFFGALVFGSLAGSFIGAWIMDSWILGIIISFIMSFFSVFGDLYESFLKRRAKVKDSGSLLPGHGGILDRLDGFLFAAPVLYIVLEFIKNI